MKYFCLASSHFPSILSSCKRLKNRPDCYVLVKRQKVFATNSNCPDNQRNLACFEEVGGSLWIIKSFYRNSETVGQQCHGFMPVPTVTETFQKEQLVFEDLRFKPDVKSTFSLLYPFSWKKAMGICKLTTFLYIWSNGLRTWVSVVILGTGSWGIHAVVAMLATGQHEHTGSGEKKSTPLD